MNEDQPRNKRKITAKATRQGRVIALWILLISFLLCFALVISAYGVININRFIAPCGMKMRTGLPCPTCGFTTAALAFFRGEFLRAFYIQPAAAIMCVVVIITVFLSFITVVFGVYFPFLKSLAEQLRTWQIVLIIIIILAGGWAVTLSRALAS